MKVRRFMTAIDGTCPATNCKKFAIFLKRLAKVKFLGSDFDGVMTDGFAYISEDGKQSVRCSEKDAMGIHIMKLIGIVPFVISGKQNKIVAARCKTIGIDCVYGAIGSPRCKEEALLKKLAELGLSPDQALFIGDDINDKGILDKVGVAFAVRDAHPEILKIVDYVTAAKGGEHAVREVCDLILGALGLQPEV